MYYKLLPQIQALNSNKYCSLFDQLKGSNWWEASGISQLEGCNLPSVQQQTSLQTWQKSIQLDQDKPLLQLYSLALVPLDYHLFRSLQNSVKEKNLNSLETCKNILKQFIFQKDAKFWVEGIMKLFQRQKFAEQNTIYRVE